MIDTNKGFGSTFGSDGFQSVSGFSISIRDVGLARNQLLQIKLVSAESVVPKSLQQGSSFDRDGYITAIDTQLHFKNLHDMK